MRFLLEFVSCCATPEKRASESSVLAEDEDRWLVPAPVVSVASASSRTRFRKKQRKAGAPDWRPSLGPISEDVVVPPKAATITPGREAKKKTSARGATKVYRRSYSDVYQGSSSPVPTIMPAFSPTPFMF
ncbi:uncharacterized protein [Cicer arietinum]|uniref:Uncharacterized protein LOC101513513 n=1 Tax=Cicer arietinum TaxID=3827 RepID=A0A1S2YIT8_CICAR|nr:uncharacterized protein LOC101513513 [Cicer arietinum]